MTPNAQLALALHRKYRSNERTVAHCQACARISKLVAETAAGRGNMVNQEAVEAGALLHEIGRSQTQLVNHGCVGAQILEKEGVDGIVVEMSEGMSAQGFQRRRRPRSASR